VTEVTGWIEYLAEEERTKSERIIGLRDQYVEFWSETLKAIFGSR